MNTKPRADDELGGLTYKTLQFSMFLVIYLISRWPEQNSCVRIEYRRNIKNNKFDKNRRKKKKIGDD